VANSVTRRALLGVAYRRSGGSKEAVKAVSRELKMNKSGNYGWNNLIWERVLLDTDYFDNILNKELNFEHTKKVNISGLQGTPIHRMVWVDEQREERGRKVRMRC